MGQLHTKHVLKLEVPLKGYTSRHFFILSCCNQLWILRRCTWLIVLNSWDVIRHILKENLVGEFNFSEKEDKGKYNNFHADLKKEPAIFFNYYEMTHETFNCILSRIEPIIIKTNHRCSISIGEQVILSDYEWISYSDGMCSAIMSMPVAAANGVCRGHRYTWLLMMRSNMYTNLYPLEACRYHWTM